MKNRYTPFGYGIEDGKFVIVPGEAEIVRGLFRDYVAGKSLKTLAEELTKKQVPYLPGKWQWNKNRVSRLLGGSRYLGDADFPQIITPEVYAMAEEKRQAWTVYDVAEPVDVINEAVVPIYCGKCGAPTKRIWNKSDQKRLCTDLDCRRGYRIRDGQFSEMLTSLLKNVDVTDTAVVPEEYTQELRHLENDLARLMNMAQPDGGQLRSLIFQIAAKKYEIASYGKHITEKLRADLHRVGLSDFITRRQVMDIVQSITLLSEEEMEVTLINGQVVRKEVHCGK